MLFKFILYNLSFKIEINILNKQNYKTISRLGLQVGNKGEVTTARGTQMNWDVDIDIPLKIKGLEKIRWRCLEWLGVIEGAWACLRAFDCCPVVVASRTLPRIDSSVSHQQMKSHLRYVVQESRIYY